MTRPRPALPGLRRAAIAAAALFGVGAVVGTLGDRIHVHYDVLFYPQPAAWLFGQAAWVPLLFGGVTILLVLGHGVLLWLVGEAAPRPSRVSVIAPFVWFGATYLSTGLFHRWPVPLAIGLALLWVVRVARRPTREMLLASVLVAISGPLSEALLSSTGGFRYYHPDALLVPLWLPALYLHVALLTRHIYLAFVAPTASEPASI
jgi:hypothetical protein